jgi:hypothetical protein
MDQRTDGMKNSEDKHTKQAKHTPQITPTTTHTTGSTQQHAGETHSTKTGRRMRSNIQHLQHHAPHNNTTAPSSTTDTDNTKEANTHATDNTHNDTHC